jgi:hypothetical protein
VSVRIVSDFDGVWTDASQEVLAVRARLREDVARACRAAPSEVETYLQEIFAVIHAAPHAHGWAPDGRITAFVDEDPMSDVDAVCRLLLLDPAWDRYAAGLRGAGFAEPTRLAHHAVMTGLRDFRATGGSLVLRGAGEILDALRDAGATVILVSNSATEKLEHYLRLAGVIPGSRAGLELRGGAEKWVLGGHDVLALAGRHFHVDRPRYRAILEEERPDLVVGDVFSLDLALPHALRTRGAPGGPRRLVLRRHGHTPAWAADHRVDGVVDYVVDHPAQLPDVVADVR